MQLQESGRNRKKFVNRDSEIEIIKNTFDDLLKNKQPLNKPIIDFFGIDGIGKTAILRQAEDLCTVRKISHLWLDANAEEKHFSSDISGQMQEYAISPEQISQAIKNLLAKKPPVVVLLDSVDITSEPQSNWVEAMLRDVTRDANICVVLASKQKLTFERDWSMVHKIKPCQLKPLNQVNSELYLAQIGQRIPAETRKIILEWTRGYPLAMNIMTEAINEHSFSIGKIEDQRQLVDVIVRRVIDEEILKKVESEKLTKYKESLGLLSFPRRFNLLIMQELFEKFAPSLVSNFRSKLAYMALPADLNRNTNVLYWDPPRAGFTIDQAIRNILLLQHKIQRADYFYKIHAFLAQKNKELADTATGTDCMRYLREYLYHSIYAEDDHHLPAIIEEVKQRIIQTPLKDEVIQFVEEFKLDEELREALGHNVSILDDSFKKHTKPEG